MFLRWVQPDLGHRSPVSGIAGPALRIALLGYVVHRVASLQKSVLFTVMALIRCHVTDRAVPVLAVVPLHETMDPPARILDALERLAWVGRRVLQRAEQALRVGVVVAHRGPAERRHYTELLQSGQHRCALHWPAIVRV